MAIRIFSLFFFVVTSASAQTKDAKRVEIFSHSLQAATPIPVTLQDITDSSRFVAESTNRYFLNALSSYCSSLDASKRKKRNLLQDYRILVVLAYEDGTSSYIAGNTVSYIEYNGKVYEDKNYQFYKLLSIYIELNTIEVFLKDHHLK